MSATVNDAEGRLRKRVRSAFNLDSRSFSDRLAQLIENLVFIHIQSRDERTLTCSGFEVSHANRKERYLKIQPVFYSYSDFREYLGSWSDRTGPTKHFDEVSKEDYDTALSDAVNHFIAARELSVPRV